jgi:hypothetical protein
LTRKATDMALNGDPIAFRLCLERLLPPRKDRPIEVNLPPVQSAREISEAMGTVFAAVGEGQITPHEAQALANMLAVQSEFVEAKHLEERLSKLEKRQSVDFGTEHLEQGPSEAEENEFPEEDELGDFDHAA